MGWEMMSVESPATVMLFSYGTLQLESVQLASFGRLLSGSADKLPRFGLTQVEIEDPQVVATSGKTHHPIVAYTGASGDDVDGMVFAITAEELAQADAYEVSSYRRDEVTLASGIRAWVYVDARSPVAISFEGDFVDRMTFNVPTGATLDGSLRATGARLEPFDLHCYTTGRFLRKVGAYEGVLLRDLITQAGLSKDPGVFKRTIFIAQAHDGYAVTFSWHELFNTAIGDQVLVAYRCDDSLLSSEDGAPILFSAADIVPAPRHMKRLRRIIARKIDV